MNEKADLEALKLQQREIALSAMFQCRSILGQDAAALKNSGYKTIEDAITGAVKYNLKKIDDLVKEHVRKYPD